MTVHGIVIITHSFDVLFLKKALNRAVLQTANLSKVVKTKRRGRRKKAMRRGEEGHGERKRRRMKSRDGRGDQ